jgi:plastocyanin
LFLFIGALAVFPFGCRPPTASPPSVLPDDKPSDSQRVMIDNFTFTPRELTVPVGTRVTWVNRDDVPHTVTDAAKPRRFDSGTLDTDDTFDHVFRTPGTYPYFCAVHPHMTAQIIVK